MPDLSILGRLIGLRPGGQQQSPPSMAGGLTASQLGYHINNPNATGYGNFSNQNTFPVNMQKPGVTVPPVPPVFNRLGLPMTPNMWSLLQQPGVFQQLLNGGPLNQQVQALGIRKPASLGSPALAPTVAPPPGGTVTPPPPPRPTNPAFGPSTLPGMFNDGSGGVTYSKTAGENNQYGYWGAGAYNPGVSPFDALFGGGGGSPMNRPSAWSFYNASA